ncbi:MAG: hypothetical protein ABIK09_13370 [Pseudomonadota bacterium]
MKRILISLAALSCLLGLSCDSGKSEPAAQPIEKAQVALIATGNVTFMLTGLNEALQFLNGSDLFQEMFAFSEDEVCEPVEAGSDAEPVCYTPEPEPVDIDLESLRKDIIEFLTDGVLVDAQLETEEGTSVTYLMKPGYFCEMFAGDDEGGGEMDLDDAGDDEGCADFLSEIPIRVRFQSTGEDLLDAEILFGEDKLHVLDIELNKGSVAVEVDLSELQAFMETVDDQAESDFGSWSLSGRIRVELVREGPKVFSLAFFVLQAVSVDGSIDGDAWAMTLAPSEWTVTVNGVSEEVALATAVGALDATIPYQAVVDSFWDTEGEMDGEEPQTPADDIIDWEAPTVTGTAQVHLAGLTGASVFKADDEAVEVTGLGLGGGTSWVKVNGVTIFSVDFNPAAGRVMDLVAGFLTGSEDLFLQTVPEFDLSVQFKMVGLEDDFQDLPGFVSDETFQALLTGASVPELRIIEGEEDGALKVQAGTLTLSSTAAPAETVTAEAGQCLFFTDSDDEGEEADPAPEGHEILSQIEVGACL